MDLALRPPGYLHGSGAFGISTPFSTPLLLIKHLYTDIFLPAHPPHIHPALLGPNMYMGMNRHREMSPPMPMHPAMMSPMQADPISLMSLGSCYPALNFMGTSPLTGHPALAGLNQLSVGGLDPLKINSLNQLAMGMGNPLAMNMNLSALQPALLRSRRNPYRDLYSYGDGGGRGSSYDLFDDIFDEGDMYLDDFDDIDDPLMLWLWMASHGGGDGGGGRRGGRKGRYRRYRSW
jgi:hypothetical protein